MTEQDEDEQHRRCFIELVALEEKGGPNAEQVARADAKDHQDSHIEDAVAQRPHGADDKGPSRIDDGCARQQEQEHIEIETERRLQANEVHAHGRIGEDRHAEDQTDPEAVAHVAHHGLHIHTCAVAHVVSHVVRYRDGGCCSGGRSGRRMDVGLRHRTGHCREGPRTGQLHRRPAAYRHAGVRFADMFGHDLAGAVEAALVDLVLERRHAGDGFIILNCHAVRGDAGGRALDPGYPAELLLDGLVVEHGQHAANVKSGCFHASLLSLMSADFAAFTSSRGAGIGPRRFEHGRSGSPAPVHSRQLAGARK